MTEFVSDIKTILHSDADVFRVLSDLSNLEKVKERIPEEKVSDFTFDADHVSFRADPVGTITFTVVEREPNKLVKFKSEHLPFDLYLWLQFVSKAEKDTKLRMTVRAEVSPMLKAVVAKPIREMMDTITDLLVQLPYDRL